jgi:type IV secretion system protein VirB8
LFEAVALAMLAPLKTVQPITLLVDRQTGYVQALDPLTPKRVGADDALTNSYLAQYVIAREGFDRATVSVDYRRVALWSTGRARSVYLAQMPATTPASPFQRYPAGTVVLVHMKSVSRLNAGTALVRFDTETTGRNGGADVAQPWISVVRFRYADAPMRLEDRLVNPLGFQVSDYRRDAEAPPPPASVQRTSSSISAPTMIVPSPQPTATPARSFARPPAGTAERPERVRPGAQIGAIERREIPFNQLPFGSPLSPAGSPATLRQASAVP